MTWIDWDAEREKCRSAIGESALHKEGMSDYELGLHIRDGFCFAFSKANIDSELIEFVDGAWQMSEISIYPCERAWGYGVALGLNWREQFREET